ncbi:peptidyl-prolyl cis-trans isomerase-like 2-like protein [Rozella allomycis CSF55]|uniref:RING-type E3 ubiquitin transferase n=1 Tax=Rozella allomycis (strain CSF55) TaxID=988480 RepID=A0A4P9YJD9_ROZAC|nr:peptidyl-prolyl cis-trans isomerase-like 2-like protein [Rozella allomycis CSF55]
MGKWTDKLYITHSEWVNIFGGKKNNENSETDFRRLPFYCCALSLQPFGTPVCTEDGTVFDLIYILPFIRKYGTNPVNGKPLKSDELIKLTFHKNSQDEYIDPVTFQVFTDHSHIVANKVSGHVYLAQTIEMLNARIKMWRDLITDEPFTRKDVITIQDPLHLQKQNMSTFHHLKHGLNDVVKEVKEKPMDTETALEMLKQTSTVESFVKPKRNPYNAAPYSKGRMAASLTSTSMPIVTVQEQALFDEEELMYTTIKTNSYVRLITNLGELNIELYSEKVPKTCYNFLMLLRSDYYKNVKFHRSIRNFMIQGGDPTGTGRGGESFWKKSFKDEFHDTLKHDSRGILSMANSGKDTNGSQL